MLVDYPNEPGSSKLGDDIVVVSKYRSPTTLSKLSGIVAGVNSSFHSQLKRFRVLLHPDVFPPSDDRLQYESFIRSFVYDRLCG